MAMMPQGDAAGIFLLLMVFAVIVVVIPIILSLLMIYKVRKRAVAWQGIFSSDDMREQLKRSNERANGFIDKIDELFDLWIDKERCRKER